MVLFERKLSLGGGLWGGGMLFNEIVVQEVAVEILVEFGVRCEPYHDRYFTADSVETASALALKAVQAGVTVFNCVSVEDVMMRENRVAGLVINWSPVEMAGLHVDPLTVGADFILDATGHAIEVVKVQ